jgi:uncharacterized protein (DUF1778 family)
MEVIKMATRKRDKQFSFRVDENEKKFIEDKIALSGKSKTDFFIEMILNGEVIITDEKEKLIAIISLTNEINKIGTNINQVAKHVNQVGSIRMDDYEYLRKRLDDIWLLLKSTL